MSGIQTICRRISTFVGGLSLSLVLTTASAQDYFVGATDARLEVTPAGQGAFSVPVKVPPGLGGLVPQVSINYATAAPNGLLGLGGSLSGVSSITRCPRTLAADGYVQGVQMQAQDAFCLGGQRLVLVKGNFYCVSHSCSLIAQYPHVGGP